MSFVFGKTKTMLYVNEMTNENIFINYALYTIIISEEDDKTNILCINRRPVFSSCYKLSSIQLQVSRS